MSNHDMPGNDYVAVAKFRIEGVHEWQSDEGLTDATAIATALDAQTQATIALAYEQRTANLIAIEALGAKDITGWSPENVESWHKRVEQIGRRIGTIQ